jgi:hypothetical membrane protein
MGIIKKIFDPEIAAWLGTLAPVCALVSIAVSLVLSPGFDWTYNAFSDLGVSEVALIFNLGLILTGLLTSIFAIGVARTEKDSIFGLIGAVGLLFLGVSAAGAGVFTEASMYMHRLVSRMCFVSLILSSIFFGVHFILKRETRALGVLALSAGILNAIAWFVIRIPGLAIMEALSGFLAIAWFIALNIRLHKKGRAKVSTQQ